MMARNRPGKSERQKSAPPGERDDQLTLATVYPANSEELPEYAK
jgi:hypothetical protein